MWIEWAQRWNWGRERYGPGHMIKIAATPFMAQPFKISFSRTRRLITLVLDRSHLLGKGWPLGPRLSNCVVVTFPLVSWVRYGAWLYRFLIFAPFLTLVCSIFGVCSNDDPRWILAYLMSRSNLLPSALKCENSWKVTFLKTVEAKVYLLIRFV